MASKSFVAHDSNARNSKKMLRMREKLGPVEGPAAYGIYWMLIERLRDEDDYISDKDYDMLAFDLRCDRELLRKVVEDYELFDISEDGETFGSHGLDERMAIMESRSAAGRKGAAGRWGKNTKNGHEMAQNGKTEDLPIAKNDFANGKGDANKINKIKERNYSSSCSSSYEFVSEEEKEKEKILYFFTFSKNWVAPNKEYEMLLAYNRGPQVRKKWEKMSAEEKNTCLRMWHQEPSQPRRFNDDFLALWQKVYEKLLETAPFAIRIAALSDGVSYVDGLSEFTLIVPESLMEYLEENMDIFKPILWPYIQSHGNNKLAYQLCK